MVEGGEGRRTLPARHHQSLALAGGQGPNSSRSTGSFHFHGACISLSSSMRKGEPGGCKRSRRRHRVAHCSSTSVGKLEKAVAVSGVCSGVLEVNSWRSRENGWKKNPESRNATSSRIWGTGRGKPAGNLRSTLQGPCPHLPCGVVFLKSTVPAFSSSSDSAVRSIAG